MTYLYTESEINAQQALVDLCQSNRKPYEHGRLSYMEGFVNCPYIDTVERVQWETGWMHECKGIERPY